MDVRRRYRGTIEGYVFDTGSLRVITDFGALFGCFEDLVCAKPTKFCNHDVRRKLDVALVGRVPCKLTVRLGCGDHGTRPDATHITKADGSRWTCWALCYRCDALTEKEEAHVKAQKLFGKELRDQPSSPYGNGSATRGGPAESFLEVAKRGSPAASCGGQAKTREDPLWWSIHDTDQYSSDDSRDYFNESKTERASDHDNDDDRAATARF